MMPMTMYGGSQFHAASPLCFLACLLLLAGLVFLFIWAAKALTTKQLKVWGIGFLLGGVVLCLIATQVGWRGDTFMMRTASMGGGMMMTKGMRMDAEDMHKMMMRDDDMEAMSMADMTDSLKDKTGDDFDKAFIEEMIVHHQGAIDMSKLAATSAKHQEVKALATAIISAQQTEIDVMKGWLKSWGYAN